ncbi:hypothetical protein [Streptomyces sp. NPDC051561]|uniref:hypothetical protein n=1 Tax=Streptomyces sp. NPDC051561 TaxID=3365658 RepID=UPI0037B0CFF5
MIRPFRFQEEDRADYRRVLDEAISSEEIQARLPGAAVNAGQLRVRALAASTSIASSAAHEYQEYTAAGRQARTTSAGNVVPLSGPPGQEQPNAGVLAVLAVLVPILSLIAAVTLLLIGYGLTLFGDHAAVTGPLVTAGWACGTVTLLATGAALVALLHTARQHRSSGIPRGAKHSPKTAVAREIWLAALRDQGVMPFLRRQLSSETGGSESGGELEVLHRPGSSSPSFTSPAMVTAGSRRDQ